MCYGFILTSLLLSEGSFTCGLSSRVSSIGSLSIPGMTATLKPTLCCLCLIIYNWSYNATVFQTNQHSPGSAHKRGSPASSRLLIGGRAVDVMMTSLISLRIKSHSFVKNILTEMILNVLNFNTLMLCWVFHQYGIMNKFTYCYISHFSNVKGKRVSLRLKIIIITSRVTSLIVLLEVFMKV